VDKNESNVLYITKEKSKKSKERNKKTPPTKQKKKQKERKRKTNLIYLVFSSLTHSLSIYLSLF